MGGTRGGAGLGLILGVVSQMLGLWFRSTEAFTSWVRSFSESFVDASVMSVSTTPKAGELVLGVLILIAVGSFGGWVGERLSNWGQRR